MGMVFMSTLAITDIITITVAVADGIVGTVARAVGLYKVEIVRPTGVRVIRARKRNRGRPNWAASLFSFA